MESKLVRTKSTNEPNVSSKTPMIPSVIHVLGVGR